MAASLRLCRRFHLSATWTACGGALGEERCSVPADHLDAWPLGESGRQTGCLSVREEINWTAGFDVHQDSAVVAALVGCVLVDTDHSRRRHVRLGKRVDQAQDRAPAHGHAEDGGQPGARPGRPGRDRVRPGSSAVVPCADRAGGSGRISAPRRSGAGTWCSGGGTAGREVAAQPFAQRSARRRENAGRNYEHGPTGPHTPGRRRQPWCTAHQHASSRCSRPPTAPRRSRSMGTTAPSDGARSHPQLRTVSPTALTTALFRATSSPVCRQSVVTQSGRCTEAEPEPATVNNC